MQWQAVAGVEMASDARVKITFCHVDRLLDVPDRCANSAPTMPKRTSAPSVVRW